MERPQDLAAAGPPVHRAVFSSNTALFVPLSFPYLSATNDRLDSENVALAWQRGIRDLAASPAATVEKSAPSAAKVFIRPAAELHQIWAIWPSIGPPFVPFKFAHFLTLCLVCLHPKSIPMASSSHREFEIGDAQTCFSTRLCHLLSPSLSSHL
ncbi:hypothetical protein E2562_009339 [Oryza meyeriana var. granulata]|uniref:Uncharacterized protein n=1 Tax=Oryza meyeriana var. granulata TaxID=110450 RepID=A0A6G1CGK0_9ORYZ|nr:hypothetical protein E2562_009339 [Oryza meyeriana var. granulata]